MKGSSSRTLIIAGGGTGGHVLPGVAIADCWRSRIGTGARVLFVGAVGGIEEKLVPRAGYPLELLGIGSLKRVGVLKRFKTLLQLPWSLVRSAAILFRERPEAVIGVGGYASGPFVLVAALLAPFLRIKTAIFEFNAIPGFTNRFLGRVVRKIFQAFDARIPQFPSAKTLTVGTPVRSELKPLPPATLDPFTIFVFGGSQGAIGINSLVLESLPHLGPLRDKLRFIHQTGEKDYERVRSAHQAAGTQADVQKFIYDMAGAYARASLLVCRSGASTLSEIATVRRAAILIPLPTAADNHQERNAEFFSSREAALLFRQEGATGRSLAELIRSLQADPSRIRKMETNVAALHRPDAAAAVLAGIGIE